MTLTNYNIEDLTWGFVIKQIEKKILNHINRQIHNSMPLYMYKEIRTQCRLPAFDNIDSKIGSQIGHQIIEEIKKF